MNLEIRRLQNNVWQHITDSGKTILSRASAKIQDNDFILSNINGQKPIATFNVSQITLIDETTVITYPTFTTGQALAVQLKALGYVGFLEEGDVIASLNDITDVTITTPSDGQVLKYNSLNQTWENQNESGGGGSALITGLKCSETSAASNSFKGQWAVRNLGFSTDGHTRDAWFTNSTGSQRLVIRFGRSIIIKKVVILNYFNNSGGNEEIVAGTGNAGVDDFTLRAITGDESLVTTSYNSDLSELTDIYTGSIPRVFNSNDIFTPTITEIAGDGLVLDGGNNHGSPSNLGIRKIWIYGE